MLIPPVEWSDHIQQTNDKGVKWVSYFINQLFKNSFDCTAIYFMNFRSSKQLQIEVNPENGVDDENKEKKCSGFWNIEGISPVVVIPTA